MMIKQKLLLGIAAAIVVCNYFALRGANDVLQKLNHWQRVPAYLAGISTEDTAELKILEGADYGKRVTVPINTFTQYRDLTDVVLLRDPNSPNSFALLDHWGMWEPILSRVLIAIALLVLGYYLWRSKVGDDMTWSDGKWLATPAGQSHIPAMSTPIKEASEARMAVVVWTAVMGIVAGLSFSGVIAHGSIFSTVIAVIATGFFLIAVWTWIETYTKRFYVTDAGLIEKTALGIKRAPWRTLKQIRLVNINREAQVRYDRTAGQNKGKRPQTINVYRVSGDGEQEIFQFSERMEPQAAFEALRDRILNSSRPASVATTNDDSDFDDEDSESDMMTSEQVDEFRLAQRRHLRAWLAGFIAVSIIFLLPAAYMTYRTLWFQFLAERSVGDIVAVSKDEAASLTLAFRTPDGKVWQTETGGSPSYAKFRVGETLTVFYDPKAPNDARADLFLENWLGTLIVGALGAALALFAWLAYRHQSKALRKPM